MAKGTEPFQEVRTYPNIRLEYQLIVEFTIAGDAVSYYCPKGAEFFVDEHDLQWVKFYPSNGYHYGKEHIMRTDHEGFMVIRNDES